MGICKSSNSGKEDNIMSTKALLETDAFGAMQFYFTTENLLRIDANCLVIFCDHKMNLSKNTFIANVGKFETRKIKEFAESHLLANKTKLEPGQIVFFPISISTLQFKFIGMVCLKQWDGHQKIRTNLEPIMINLFKQLVSRHVQSLAITEFNEQFGIPTQVACQVLSSVLLENRQKLKILTLICNNASSQKYYMDKINQLGELDKSGYKTSMNASSMYY